jgi:hypothetical protein
MGKSDAWETNLLKLVFNNVAAAGIGDTNGVLPSAAAGNLYLSLHTGDPGDTGNQSSSETTYTGYARVAVARSSAGFNVTGNSVNLVTNADFGTCTANPGAALTYFAVGTLASGAGQILYSGPLSSSIPIAANIAPRITTAANMITED